MKLTLKKLIWATVAFIALDILYLWIRSNYGLNWFSPTTLKYWTKDIALVIAWVLYFVDKKKK